MKPFLIIAFVALLNYQEASAQNDKVIDASKAVVPLNKRVTVLDSVYSFKTSAEATTIYLGGEYPHQRLTVLLKQDAITDPDFFADKVVMVTGIVRKIAGRTKMLITDQHDFWAKKNDTTGGHTEIFAVSQGKPPITAKEAMKVVGKVVHIRDTVYDFKAVSRSFGLLYVGSKIRSRALTIVFKNMRPKTNLKSFVGTILNMDGKVFFYHHRPAMIWSNFGYRYSL